MANPAITTIPVPFKPPNLLDHAVHSTGRKLQALRMTRLLAVGNPNKGEAQALTRDLLDIAKICDDMLLAIGREARSHFGHGVDLEQFTDQMLRAIEGNATYVICAAAEGWAEDRSAFLEAAE